MKNKLRVAILFGGKSAEHEISLISARNIVKAMDKRKYEILAIGIDKQGRWFHDPEARLLLEHEQKRVTLSGDRHLTAVLPGATKSPLVRFKGGRDLETVDVVFPVLHGPFGEDGTVQGLLQLANVPFVGAGVLGSAIGMDKDVMKRLLRDAGIPIGRFLVYDRSTANRIQFASVKKVLGQPLFVKPANLGSSVGISKVNNRAELDAAVKTALRFDDKILLEEFIQGREVECSVLGNEKPIASLPGEIITGHNFYSYDAKYIDDQGARLVVPAKLPKATVGKIRQAAVRTFKALCCEGMARVDFFVQSDGKVLVNEINTIPGFTQISMYPKMWEASGIPYAKLIDRLIQLALRRFRQEQNLRTTI
ncbi:MAG: D-alanine--D-alanine ligase [Candidatus Binatia bacterium]